MQLTTITDETRLVLANLGDRATGIVTPSVRLGVTGLARAGKTVFITALVHNLIHGGRLPLFKAYAGGRISGAMLQPQPDDDVPRFDYERHVAALVDERIWPDSTRQVSELRLTVRYESASFLSRTLTSGKLHVDLVDYPGEWLLDLPLLSKNYADVVARSDRQGGDREQPRARRTRSSRSSTRSTRTPRRTRRRRANSPRSSPPTSAPCAASTARSRPSRRDAS